MPKPSAAVELDDAIEAVMDDPAARPLVSAGLNVLVRLAGDLRELPDPDFKARLAAELNDAARKDPRIAASPALVAHDLNAVLRATPAVTISAASTGAQVDEAFRRLASFNESTLFVGRFTGRSPWERHRGGDELLYILEGEVEITVLTDDGPVPTVARANSLFICPKGLWHRLHAPGGVTALYATPRPTDVSFADDPRV
jgi:quercetin dioxygenase-like cupin family protein